jgi:hypothetical protein
MKCACCCYTCIMNSCSMLVKTRTFKYNFEKHIIQYRHITLPHLWRLWTWTYVGKHYQMKYYSFKFHTSCKKIAVIINCEPLKSNTFKSKYKYTGGNNLYIHIWLWYKKNSLCVCRYEQPNDQVHSRLDLHLGSGPLSPDTPRPFWTGPLCPISNHGSPAALLKFQI